MNIRLHRTIILPLMIIVSGVFWYLNTVLGIHHTIFNTIYIFCTMFGTGLALFRHKTLLPMFLMGAWSYIAFVIIITTSIYYFFQLDAFTIFSILSITGIVPVFFAPKKYESNITIDSIFDNKKVIITGLLFVTYITLVISIAHLLGTHPITYATRSLWLEIPPIIYPLYFATTITLLLLTLRCRETLSMLLIVIHYIISFSFIWSLYKLGYGFDPFLHQASEKILSATGTLLPKPPYYIGQYVLVVIIEKLFALDIVSIDRLLVPMCASIFIPSVIYSVFKNSFSLETKLLPLLSLTPLCFVFTEFTYSTPQAFANLFALITVLLSIYYISDTRTSSITVILPALATMAIHPLTGIPIVGFVALLMFYHRIQHHLPISTNLRRIIFIEIIVLCIIALPLALVISTSSIGMRVAETSTHFWSVFQAIIPNIYWHDFHEIPNLVYTYLFNQNILIIMMGAVGLWVVSRRNKIQYFSIYPIYFIALLITYIILSVGVDFSFLISYEQNVFPLRILHLSFFFLYPLVLIFVYWLLQKNILRSGAHMLLLIFCATIAISSAWYGSYPRFDNFYKDKGYSPTEIDFQIVQALENAQQDNEYVVLANQAVAAAAIQLFGFKKYYTDQDIFYYPVPTSSPLYKIYSDMVYDTPSREKAGEAATLTGVHDVYFVINKYWNNYEAIVEQAKASSTEWWSVNFGEAHVFYYKF